MHWIVIYPVQEQCEFDLKLKAVQHMLGYDF